MTSNATTKGKTKKGQVMLYLSLVSFSLYMANVLIGKAKVLFNWHFWNLGNVGEFLLLFLASTLLIVSALQREAALGNGSQTPSVKGEVT